MKRLTALLAVLLIFLIPAANAAEPDRVNDIAGLLTDSQEDRLRGQIEDIAQEYQFDAVIVTVDSLDGKSAEAYADDYFDYNGYGYGTDADGILMLVSMEYRDWAISTCGRGLEVFTDYGLDYMSDEIVPYLSDGDYYSAFECFLTLVEDYLNEAEEYIPYDTNNMPGGGAVAREEESNWLIFVVGSLIVGLIAALIVTGSMKSKLKSVRPQVDARQYAGNFELTLANDLFLYRTVAKTAKPTNNSSSGRSGGGGSSSHRSSSGRSHGGSRGKF